MARRPAKYNGKYNGYYQRVRKGMLARRTLDEPCCRCGIPLGQPGPKSKPGKPDPPELGHDDETGAIRGWEHRSCNRSAGALKLALMRGSTLSERRCVVCGTPFEAPNHRETMTCSASSCIAELRRRRRAHYGDGEPPEFSGRVW